MTEEQIKKMVDRFLQWKLPEDFNPDGGVTFKQYSDYEHPVHGRHKYEPSGTNLFHWGQAEQMVRFMLEGVTDKDTVTLKRSEVELVNFLQKHLPDMLRCADEYKKQCTPNMHVQSFLEIRLTQLQELLENVLWKGEE